MTVSFSLTKLTNGTLADADVVMSNESFLLVPALDFALDGATTTNQDNFLIDLDLSTGIDTGNTTAFLFGSDYLCQSTGTAEESVFDNFNDGSVASLWTITSTTNAYDTVTVFNETSFSGYSYANILKGTATSGTDPSTTITQNTGTDMRGKTVVIEYDYSFARAGSGSTETFGLKFYLGNVQTYFENISSSGTKSGTGIKIKYQPSSVNPDTSVEVFINTGAGYVTQGDVDVSSISGKHFVKVKLDLDSNDPTTGNNYWVKLNNLWIDNYTTSVLITSDNALDSSSDVFITKTKYSTLSTEDITSVEFSTDSGVSYEAGLPRVLFNHSTASTTLTLKFVYGYDNSTPTAQTTSIVSGYAAYYG